MSATSFAPRAEPTNSTRSSPARCIATLHERLEPAVLLLSATDDGRDLRRARRVRARPVELDDAAPGRGHLHRTAAGVACDVPLGAAEARRVDARRPQVLFVAG